MQRYALRRATKVAYFTAHPCQRQHARMPTIHAECVCADHVPNHVPNDLSSGACDLQ
jgi:hypothetical protein